MWYLLLILRGVPTPDLLIPQPLTLEQCEVLAADLNSNNFNEAKCVPESDKLNYRSAW